MKIIMSSGATREPIDNVRFISNMSTGKTGRTIAEYLDSNGDEVVFLYGQGSERPALVNGSCIEFKSTSHLDSLLKDQLGSVAFDTVIQMAAVSDYQVHKINGVEITSSTEKIDSSNELNIEFKKNKKVLPLLKSYSINSEISVIGFKLTSHADEALIKKKLKKVFTDDVDFIIHNDLSEITSDMHNANLYNRQAIQNKFKNKREIAQGIYKLIHNRSL